MTRPARVVGQDEREGLHRDVVHVDPRARALGGPGLRLLPVWAGSGPPRPPSARGSLGRIRPPGLVDPAQGGGGHLQAGVFPSEGGPTQAVRRRAGEVAGLQPRATDRPMARPATARTAAPRKSGGQPIASPPPGPTGRRWRARHRQGRDRPGQGVPSLIGARAVAGPLVVLRVGGRPRRVGVGQGQVELDRVLPSTRKSPRPRAGFEEQGRDQAIGQRPKRDGKRASAHRQGPPVSKVASVQASNLASWASPTFDPLADRLGPPRGEYAPGSCRGEETCRMMLARSFFATLPERPPPHPAGRSSAPASAAKVESRFGGSFGVTAFLGHASPPARFGVGQGRPDRSRLQQRDAARSEGDAIPRDALRQFLPHSGGPRDQPARVFSLGHLDGSSR